MSSVVISGDTSGAITLAAPAVAGTNTLTLPAVTGNVLTSVSTGTIVAMVQFTVASSTVTIRNSFNVTSVTRTGAGIYSIAFTNSVGSNPYITTSGGGVAGVYDAFSTISATAPTGTTAIVIGVAIPALTLVDLGTCTVIAYKI